MLLVLFSYPPIFIKRRIINFIYNFTRQVVSERSNQKRAGSQLVILHALYVRGQFFGTLQIYIYLIESPSAVKKINLF